MGGLTFGLVRFEGMSDVRVSNNEAEKRYEARVDGELVGAAYYDAADDLIVFTHTEVDEEAEGHGVGSALARGALDVWHTPITMKKGRPATMLSVLCRPADGPALTELVLCLTPGPAHPCRARMPSKIAR